MAVRSSVGIVATSFTARTSTHNPGSQSHSFSSHAHSTVTMVARFRFGELRELPPFLAAAGFSVGT